MKWQNAMPTSPHIIYKSSYVAIAIVNKYVSNTLRNTLKYIMCFCRKVSGFGFGGSNANAVLVAVASTQRPSRRRPVVVPLSRVGDLQAQGRRWSLENRRPGQMETYRALRGPRP